MFRFIFCCNRKELPTRCGQCKADSATNEILSERERKTTLAYDTPTWHSNYTLNNHSYGYGGVSDTKRDLVDKDSLEDTNVAPSKDFPLVNNNASLSRLTKGLEDVEDTRKDFICHTEDTLVDRVLLTVNQFARPSDDSCVIPVLDLNDIALLDDLPETNC